MYLVPILSILFLATCGEQPTSPESSESLATPVFKPKCETPPCNGGDDPPPPADQAILYSDAAGSRGIQDPTLSILRMNADGTDVDRVFDDAVEYWSDNTQPAWAPDGEQFAFKRFVWVFEKNKLVSRTHQIAAGRTDGTGFIRIREIAYGSGSLYRPRWSPVAVGGVERVAWVEDRSVAGQAAIVMARSDTWDFETVLVAGPDEHFGNMTWSRSGEQILIEGWHNSTQQSFLRLYDVSCTANCTASPAGDLSLSPFGPDNSFQHVDWAHLHDWVLVPVQPHGSNNTDAWLIDLETSDTRPLTQTNLDVQDGVWSSCDDSVLLLVWGTFGKKQRNKLIRLYLNALPQGVPWDGSLDDPSIAEVIADVNPAGIDWRPPTPSATCGS
jgi:hypothetical protein